jgi:hypothetical protein
MLQFLFGFICGVAATVIFGLMIRSRTGDIKYGHLADDNPDPDDPPGV